MDRVKVEIFLSTTTCSNSASLIELLKEIQEEFGEKVEIITYQGPNELFDKYNLTALPAVVVEEIVKIVGFCPSKESLISALKEVGLE
jgi:predicted thioredoxin/glutaredoxin